jgi:hypothetical protein
MDNEVVHDLWIVKIAEACHEANRAICEATGDFSQKTWNDAEQWQKLSAIKGVRFAINNPDSTPKAQHDAWLANKLADGWVYGRVKDDTKKTHPCLVSYESLPENQKIKDHVFRAIVKSLW